MTITIKETYKDFYAFLKNPTDETFPIQTARHKIVTLFSVLAIEIPIVSIIATTIFGIEKLGLIDTGAHKLNTLFQNFPIWKFVLWGVIINPFLEELIFRLGLRYNFKNFKNYSILPVSAIGTRSLTKIEIYLNHFWRSKFRLIFFFSAAIFAYFHLSNYQLSSTVLLLSPILIAPQFITALFLGYLRIRYSFMLGYFLHAIHNTFFIIVSLILMNIS